MPQSECFILTENNPNGEKEIRIKMKEKIESNAKFQVLSHSFSVSPSSSAYTLKYSANGTDWTPFETEVPASETLIVTDCAFGQYIWLDGFTPDGEGALIY